MIITKQSTQDTLIKLYENTNIDIPKVTYESGSPLQYKGDFLKLWLIHMEYLKSIRSFPTPIVNEQVFNESLNKFIQKHKKVNLFIAKRESNVIGVLQAGVANSNYGFISDLHVLEDYRKYGIGRNLLQNSLRWFVKNNVSEIGLEVSGGNEGALKFYKRNGFDVDMYSLKIKL